MDWFLNNESANLNRLRLVEGVRKQWLDTDIRKADVQKEPRLQAGHLAKGKLKALSPLQGTFVFQVLTAVDISKPAYNQLEGKWHMICTIFLFCHFLSKALNRYLY